MRAKPLVPLLVLFLTPGIVSAGPLKKYTEPASAQAFQNIRPSFDQKDWQLRMNYAKKNRASGRRIMVKGFLLAGGSISGMLLTNYFSCRLSPENYHKLMRAGQYSLLGAGGLMAYGGYKYISWNEKIGMLGREGESRGFINNEGVIGIKLSF